MKYFTVHSVCEDFFKLILKDYTLTFDDALYSQYFYWEEIDKIDCEKILFIPTGAIRLTKDIRERFVGEYVKFDDCFQSLKKWKYFDNRENYMTLGEIKYLIDNYNITIGGHSHNHEHVSSTNSPGDLVDSIKFIMDDIDKMFKWFDLHLSLRPHHFCFPFNERNNYLKILLEKEGITNFYGDEREEVITLCRNQ